MKWIQYFLSWAGAGAIIVSSTEYIWSGLCSQEVIAPTLVCSMLLGAATLLFRLERIPRPAVYLLHAAACYAVLMTAVFRVCLNYGMQQISWNSTPVFKFYTIVFLVFYPVFLMLRYWYLTYTAAAVTKDIQNWTL